MSVASRSLVTLQLCVLSLLSAFLLFQVQPVISKFILPWFGGSPGVWTTCMLFFQVLLFGGYAYAHVLTRLPHRWQGIIHAVLVLAAAATLPISPGEQWKPNGGDDPTQGILMLLLANVALPYFVLSSTSPLVQVWFSRGGSGRAPWRLYALSNVGSLAALLTYPFVFEPRWSVGEQTWMWSIGFVAFALLSLLGTYGDWRGREPQPLSTGPDVQKEVTIVPAAPEWWRRGLWLLLPAIASVFLLASTNHLCQDVAVIPFLWVVPLSLYLLTFIICFDVERASVVWLLMALALTAFMTGFELKLSEYFEQTPELRWLWLAPVVAIMRTGYLRWLWAPLAAVLAFTAAAPDTTSSWISSAASTITGDVISWEITPDFRWEIGLVSLAMFCGCMVCHGELARLKPHPSRLTEFYLMMSAGGALGGLFVSLVAKQLFSTYLEWPGVLMATLIVASIVAVLMVLRLRLAWLQSHARWVALVIASLVVGVAGKGAHYLVDKEAIFTAEPRIEYVRNFYGVISVKDEYNNEEDAEDQRWRSLYHGGILHGQQYLSKHWRNEPLSYYGHETGIGLALLTLKDRPDARVGVVGMGTGTVAAYGSAGQVYRFYDINPDIVRVARQHFFYLGDMTTRGGVLEVALGDARLSMEHEPPQKFDALLLDAFSGDSVPVHLLTQEAFAIYKKHMKPDGIIAVHVSNRYLVLAPVIEKVAASLGWKTTRILTQEEGFDMATDYVMVTNNQAFLDANPTHEATSEEPEINNLWTDKMHNLFEILEK